MDGLSRFKIDDLGVPQFMETPIYSLMKLMVSHHWAYNMYRVGLELI